MSPKKYQAVIFDLGNTLIHGDYSGRPVEERKVLLMDGVAELIEKLNGNFKLAIVSNTIEITSNQIRSKLAEVNLADNFEIIIATAEIGVHKPDPKPIQVALEKLNLQPEACIYVGDLETDQMAAEAAGVDFIYSGTNLDKEFWLNLSNRDSAYERALVGKWNFDSDFDFAARKKFDQLVKPPGSLGRLEKIVGKISGIRKTHRPSVDPAAIAVFIADHGIAKDDSVTPWPQIITKQMGDLAASGKAAISAFAAANDLYLEIVNVGTVDSTSHPDIYNHRIGAGTNDVRFGPAMTHVDAIHALEIGARTAERLIAGGSRFLGVGEIGIGNTTIAAAIISYITNTPASKVTGRGSGISDETFLRKQEIVEKLAQLPDQLSGVEILERIGGYEIAAIAGFILRASSQGVPVLLDGVNTNAAALIASQIKESCRLSLLAAHNSAEPGATVALKYLELEPILDLGLRLGEGTGAALAIPILRAACRAFNEMAQLSDLE
ncbi:MAG: hypothetical protein RL301_300 [Actinomycetota bacterium]